MTYSYLHAGLLYANQAIQSPNCLALPLLSSYRPTLQTTTLLPQSPSPHNGYQTRNSPYTPEPTEMIPTSPSHTCLPCLTHSLPQILIRIPPRSAS